MELAAKLTDDHLEKAQEMLDKGYPEYVVSSLIGVPYTTWKYWKRQARVVRDVIEEGIVELFDLGILAVDGTRLNFMLADGDIARRFPDLESAIEYKKHNNLDCEIEDQTELVESLIAAKTSLSVGQDKVLTLLTYCEKGKAYALSEHIDNISHQSRDHWQASAWWAERQDRENFGRQDTVINKNLNADVTGTLTEEENQQFKDNLASIFPNLKESE